MGVCAGHEFMQPTGVGDLQKGKRFTNMDYIFALILRHKDPRLCKIILYDIVCQWWKFLLKRMAQLPPPGVHHNRELEPKRHAAFRMFRFVIPKMHIHAHTLDCQVKFLAEPCPGERAKQTGKGSSDLMRQSAPSLAAHESVDPGPDTTPLDNHWSFWNWLKTIGLSEHVQNVLSLQQTEQVLAWKKMVEDFEADGTKKNPYKLKVSSLTEMEVRLQFAKEEEEEAKKGMPLLHKVTPSTFIAAGLELEEQQYVHLLLSAMDTDLIMIVV
ncbi:hypothetical protein B0H14DRAFT_2395267 [Mycena olivaceomarginata]|nr:hypothetical protein B0H14DRAFT_2395267 [Mycena olivaceomarginata]